jgi:hypothetical protein
MQYRATLYNNNTPFDSVIMSGINEIKEWAKDRGDTYGLNIKTYHDGDLPEEHVINYMIKNNRFYKIRN